MKGRNVKERMMAEANQFLKRPYSKIQNKNKDLSKAYGTQFFKNPKFEYLQTLKRIKRRPPHIEDSISCSEHSSDEEYSLHEKRKVRTQTKEEKGRTQKSVKGSNCERNEQEQQSPTFSDSSSGSESSSENSSSSQSQLSGSSQKQSLISFKVLEDKRNSILARENKKNVEQREKQTQQESYGKIKNNTTFKQKRQQLKKKIKNNTTFKLKKQEYNEQIKSSTTSKQRQQRSNEQIKNNAILQKKRQEPKRKIINNTTIKQKQQESNKQIKNSIIFKQKRQESNEENKSNTTSKQKLQEPNEQIKDIINKKVIQPPSKSNVSLRGPKIKTSKQSDKLQYSCQQKILGSKLQIIQNIPHRIEPQLHKEVSSDNEQPTLQLKQLPKRIFCYNKYFNVLRLTLQCDGTHFDITHKNTDKSNQ